MSTPPCARCESAIPPARAHYLATHHPDIAPTCIACQQVIDTALARPVPTPADTAPATIDSRGLPDYSTPPEPTPRPKIVGPDVDSAAIPSGGWQRDRVEPSTIVTLTGELTTVTRESPGLAPTVTAHLRDRLASVGITSLASYRANLAATGDTGRHHRKATRRAVETCLRDDAVTPWLAAQSRAEAEADADPGTITGQAILPSPEALIVGDTGTGRHPESLSEVAQPHDDAASWAAHFERDSHRREQSPWTPGPGGAPLGAILVTAPDGTPRTDLPWSRCASDGCDALTFRPVPCESCESVRQGQRQSQGAGTSAAERQRRRRARNRAARILERATLSGDVQRLAAAQRAAQRQVSVAASSHPWE